jgi:hypothetical protein
MALLQSKKKNPKEPSLRSLVSSSDIKIKHLEPTSTPVLLKGQEIRHNTVPIVWSRSHFTLSFNAWRYIFENFQYQRNLSVKTH